MFLSQGYHNLIQVIKYLVKCVPTGHIAQPYLIFQELTKYYLPDGLEQALAPFEKS